MVPWNRRFLLEIIICRFHVKLGECSFHFGGVPKFGVFQDVKTVVDPSLVNVARVKWPTLKIHYPQSTITLWFKVTFLGWLSGPFKWLSDLQLGDQKVTAWITWYRARNFQCIFFSLADFWVSVGGANSSLDGTADRKVAAQTRSTKWGRWQFL